MSLRFQVVSHGSPEYAQTVALRLRILREPLGLTLTPEQLAEETSDLHLTAFLADTLVGCLVLTPLSSTEVKMRQVAIDIAFQRQGIGKHLVAFSEQVAREHGYTKMVLHARETAVPFYLSLAYEIVGEPFTEVTLPHRSMQKSLPAV